MDLLLNVLGYETIYVSRPTWGKFKHVGCFTHYQGSVENNVLSLEVYKLSPVYIKCCIKECPLGFAGSPTTPCLGKKLPFCFSL